MCALDRDIEHLAAEHIGGADTARNHGSPCAVHARVRPLCAAQSEFHDAVALGRIHDTFCLGGNQALVVDDIEQGRLHQLRLHDGGNDLDQRFPWEDDGSLRNRIDITGKAEVAEIFQEVFLEYPQASQVLNVAAVKTQVPDVFNHLLQPGADGKAIAVGIGAVEHVKDYGLVGVLFLKISLHHGQFIQVCQ